MLRAFSIWYLTSVVRSSSLRLIAVLFYRVPHSCKMAKKSRIPIAFGNKCADLFLHRFPSQVPLMDKHNRRGRWKIFCLCQARWANPSRYPRAGRHGRVIIIVTINFLREVRCVPLVWFYLLPACLSYLTPEVFLAKILKIISQKITAYVIFRFITFSSLLLCFFGFTIRKSWI